MDGRVQGVAGLGRGCHDAVAGEEPQDTIGEDVEGARPALVLGEQAHLQVAVRCAPLRLRPRNGVGLLTLPVTAPPLSDPPLSAPVK